MKRFISPEPLEARIAPAVFLVSATSPEIFDSSGNNAEDLPNEIAAQTNVGADAAILMITGDKLVFDANRNNQIDTTDPLFVQVDAGHAMVFLRDLNDDFVFDRTELRGMAVSDAFAGLVQGDVNGNIGTFLTATDEVLLTNGRLTLQPSSIATLHISGAVTGNIAAGGNITDLTIGKPILAGAGETSVGRLSTGTEADEVSYNFGNTNLQVNAFTPTGAGGNIGNVTLARGATTIIAGDGASSAIGFDGGSVTNLKVLDLFSQTSITSGRGGNGTAGNAGNAGAIEHLTLTGTVSDGPITVASGSGANSTGGGNGGAGGLINDVTIQVPQLFGSIEFDAGSGGNAPATGGNGGPSGAVQHVTIQCASFLKGNIDLHSESGGAGKTAGLGGTQGSISNVLIAAGYINGNINLGGG
jgi:hypothetical protein